MQLFKVNFILRTLNCGKQVFYHQVFDVPRELFLDYFLCHKLIKYKLTHKNCGF